MPPPTGIQERVVQEELHAVFLQAATAADAASEGLPDSVGPRQRASARRQAAGAALQAGFARLGLDSDALGVGLQSEPEDIFSSSQPMKASS